MFTLTIILLLLFVPATRRIIGGIFSAILGAVGITFAVTRNSGANRRRGL